MMHPIFDSLSVKYPNTVFIRVDSDQNRELAGTYSVSALPTFIFFFHGDEVIASREPTPADWSLRSSSTRRLRLPSRERERRWEAMCSAVRRTFAKCVCGTTRT